LRAIRAVGTGALHDFGTGRCVKNGQIVPISVHSPAVLIDSIDVIPEVGRSFE
jgi:hypothetical protein